LLRSPQLDVDAQVENISQGGLLIRAGSIDLNPGDELSELYITIDDLTLSLPIASVVRKIAGDGQDPSTLVGCRFQSSIDKALERLMPLLRPAPYVTGELLDQPGEGTVEKLSLRDMRRFWKTEGTDLLSKCRHSSEYARRLRDAGAYQALYRITLTSKLDHRSTVYNPFRLQEEEIICFDSNGYLGLHVDPRVIEATRRALQTFGYGTPSSQILSGTNRHLRELEETISEYHGREDTIVFSSGFAANVGTITALIAENDRIIADEYSHASIQDALEWSASRDVSLYAHSDIDALTYRLSTKRARQGGTLIVSDGVFSMQGDLANLPALRAIADAHSALLMLDEAHATGVIGPRGRGTEEHYGCEGAVDILMGTLSKAPGTVGGYVSGSEELVTHLRFFARTAVFSTSLPAALCAGATEAFRIMMHDPEPRERLWANVRAMADGLVTAGFKIPQPQSPIIPLPIGDADRLVRVSRDLYAKGIRCAGVSFPAVPMGAEILRITVNARHTMEDIERCLDALGETGRRHGLLGQLV
jgi:8-amino-7-oxononanoate synthase